MRTIVTSEQRTSGSGERGLHHAAPFISGGDVLRHLHGWREEIYKTPLNLSWFRRGWELCLPDDKRTRGQAIPSHVRSHSWETAAPSGEVDPLRREHRTKEGDTCMGDDFLRLTLQEGC